MLFPPFFDLPVYGMLIVFDFRFAYVKKTKKAKILSCRTRVYAL